jgi:UTP:GlnB (protein PII) uridylyltransferase
MLTDWLKASRWVPLKSPSSRIKLHPTRCDDVLARLGVQESSAKLAMGLPAAAAYALSTSVKVLPVDSAASCICIETPDRPGLLMEIANVLTDISVQILSAEIHTEVSQTDNDQANDLGAQVSQALPNLLPL